MLILVINPGSTSTKIAVYEDEKPMLLRNIGHPTDELSRFEEVTDQFEFRKQMVIERVADDMGMCPSTLRPLLAGVVWPNHSRAVCMRLTSKCSTTCAKPYTSMPATWAASLPMR